MKKLLLTLPILAALGLSACSNPAGLAAVGAVGYVAYAAMTPEEAQKITYADLVRMCPQQQLAALQKQTDNLQMLAKGMPKSYVGHVAGKPSKVKNVRLASGEFYQVWLYQTGGMETCPVNPTQDKYTPVVLNGNGEYLTQGKNFLDTYLNPFLEAPIALNDYES